MSKPGVLFLIPNVLDGGQPGHVITENSLNLVKKLRYFIVEDERSARAFLARAGMKELLDSLQWAILNEHSKETEVLGMLQPILEGIDAGLMSEAGCPGIADPGADLIAYAHDLEISVKPLVGPSSILLSLMASGLNGQSFAFAGYLPVKHEMRIRKLRELEAAIKKTGQTQIFIETPYRNLALFQDIIQYVSPSMRLTVARELSSPSEWIKTYRISHWKSIKPDIHKKPVVFLLGY